jgi:hypothetical protein
LIERTHGGKSQVISQRTDEVLNQKEPHISDQRWSSPHHVVVVHAGLDPGDEAEAEEEVEDNETEDEQGDEDELEDDDLLVPVLAVDHLLKFLLHGYGAVFGLIHPPALLELHL